MALLSLNNICALAFNSQSLPASVNPATSLEMKHFCYKFRRIVTNAPLMFSLAPDNENTLPTPPFLNHTKHTYFGSHLIQKLGKKFAHTLHFHLARLLSRNKKQDIS